MLRDLPLFPDQASTLAGRVDALFFFLVAVAVFFVALIFGTIAVFAVKYRRRSPAERPRALRGSLWLELLWTVVPFGLTMVMFAWGASVYFAAARPPRDALEIYVVAKQWMWKVEHPEGRQEINELHVPVGRAVKLTMTSQDVIHSFFVPAFRVKQDVLPGRYTTLWFEATKPGDYRLFCAEYCGTQHSGMIGRVVAMDPVAYEAWLGGGATGISMAAAGEALFRRLGCDTCHRPDGTGKGPSLVGIYGKEVRLENGATVLADEGYIRESVLNPNAKIVAGYRPTMPTFRGLISEEGLAQIIANIKSQGRQEQQRAER